MSTFSGEWELHRTTFGSGTHQGSVQESLFHPLCFAAGSQKVTSESWSQHILGAEQPFLRGVFGGGRPTVQEQRPL